MINMITYPCNLYLAGERRGHNKTTHQIIICSTEFANRKEAAIIDCPIRSLINLTYVNFGRTQPYSEVCNSSRGKDRTDCTANANVTQRAKELCQGRQRCLLTFDDLHLWDTCYGTYKYFEVNYTCVNQGEICIDMRSLLQTDIKYDNDKFMTAT